MVEIHKNIYNKSLEKIQELSGEALQCDTTLFNQLWIIILCLALLIFLYIIYRNIDSIKEYILKTKASKGYIKVIFISENKRLITKLIKLDKFTNFTIKSKKYTLEKMYDFLIGYDRFGFPVFMFDFQFILPLAITKKNINAQIREQLGLKDTTKDNDKISSIALKIDSNILSTVYKKKLMSDLYSISKKSIWEDKTLLYIIGGAILLFFLWQTGYLDQILGEFIK